MNNNGTALALTYTVDRDTSLPRVTSIRNVELPEGVLYAPAEAPAETRTLSPKAVQVVAGIFEWAEASRRDAPKD